MRSSTDESGFPWGEELLLKRMVRNLGWMAAGS